VLKTQTENVIYIYIKDAKAVEKAQNGKATATSWWKMAPTLTDQTLPPHTQTSQIFQTSFLRFAAIVRIFGEKYYMRPMIRPRNTLTYFGAWCHYVAVNRVVYKLPFGFDYCSQM
jgi:hypothetical protein